MLQNTTSNPQNNYAEHTTIWAKNSNKTNNDAERGEYVLFKVGMLAILFCYRQTGTGITRLEAKTNVAFECEFVCCVAGLKHYSSEIF